MDTPIKKPVEATFNDVVSALWETLERVKRMESFLEKRFIAIPEKTTSTTWFDMKGLRDYLPDHPAAPTVYGWVRNGLIPYYKKGKKLGFKKSEIDEWLNSSRQNTDAELQEEAVNYVNERRLRK